MILSGCLLVWCEVVVVCGFYFFFQQAVSQRFKEVIIVEVIEVPKAQERRSALTGLTGSRMHGGRLLAKCRLISTNKEVDY